MQERIEGIPGAGQLSRAARPAAMRPWRVARAGAVSVTLAVIGPQLATTAWAQTAAADAATPAAVAAGPWPVAGNLGVMQFVVLPAGASAPDEAAYRHQAGLLCGEVPTCFLRFFDNPQGLPLSMPLADEILTRPTARYSRSGKRGAAVFEWSCRVAPTDGYCF